MLQISNRRMRRALLCLNGLSRAWPHDPPPGPASTGAERALEMVRRLGFVQVDSICAVARPQHHILFTRDARFRREHLEQLLVRDRRLFENWTHDAAILPVELFPYWRHYFERVKRFEAHPGYRRYFAPVTERDIRRVMERIRRRGPSKPADFVSRKAAFDDDYFARPTLAKLTLELLWRTGRLAVSHRAGRVKVYDRVERVIPATERKRRFSRKQYVDWACREALARLGAATPAQIARFFDAVGKREAERWCESAPGRSLVTVRIANADGSVGPPCYAPTALIEALDALPAAPRRMRLLNPFDPLIHDRRRTLRLFGFDYSAEIWIPPARRKYGYYVLPILEGERFTGRLDARVDRQAGTLRVLGLWWEAGVRETPARRERLQRRLQELARFCGAADVAFARGVLRA